MPPGAVLAWLPAWEGGHNIWVLAEGRTDVASPTRPSPWTGSRASPDIRAFHRREATEAHEVGDGRPKRAVGVGHTGARTTSVICL